MEIREHLPGPFWEEDSRDVFLLGAGFSIAVASHFPGTDGLGNLVIKRLREEGRVGADDPWVPGKFQGGQFETWLARLADDQPYLSAAENLRNRALFVEASRAVRDVLVGCEERVADRTPAWLFDLVGVWHARRVQIITLNYDTLIERCVAQHLLTDFVKIRRITPSAILDGLPPAPAEATWLSGTGLNTFRLLKLHGSTSWFWVPGDATGSTIQRWEPSWNQRDADPSLEAERRRALPGRDPFIIPPTTTKAGFYNNPLTHEIWTRAHEALRTAKRVYLVGYSFPLSDVSVSGLLADALQGREAEVEVHVVNRTPKPIQKNLRAIGFPTPNTMAEDDCVQDLATQYVEETAREVLAYLQKWCPQVGSVYLTLAWERTEGQFLEVPVRTVSFDESCRTAILGVAQQTGADQPAPDALLRQFSAEITRADRLVADFVSKRYVIVNCRLGARSSPPSPPDWFIRVIPAGLPPRGVQLQTVAPLK